MNDADYVKLEGSWITRDLAFRALLRRVTSAEGAQIVGRNDNGTYAGIIFPYVWPGEEYAREYRLRRDHPDIQFDAKGRPKEKNKYLAPPGRRNLLYCVPSTRPELLSDAQVPVAITEGEKKTMVLHRLSWHELRESPNGIPRFLPIGLGGVWSFTSTIGKIPGPDGARRDEKGLLPDLERLVWTGRSVYVVYDSNVRTNQSVAAARRVLTGELSRRGASVRWVRCRCLPRSHVINGVDDLLAEWGPERVLKLFDDAEAAPTDSEYKQAQRLISLAEEVELFHTPAGEAYGRLAVGGHHETWILRSKAFRRWLSMTFYETYGKPPSIQALQDSVGILEAKAQFKSPEAELSVRVAEHGDRIYVDLCDAEWRAVEISAVGWRVISDPPVWFRRAKGMLALPTPVEGGSITALRKFINVGDDGNWVLCIAWLVAAVRPRGPYPLLVLQGEQGSAKSTMEKLLRRIVDPSVALVRTPPREERDLLIAATNSWVIANDNLSGVSQWLSDSLCRLATGGGFSTRELYTDSEEVFFNAMRPVILNGIDQLAERADLADRALILTLPRIDDRDRKDEAQLYASFEKELPQILGALFKALSATLTDLPEIELPSKPRMADFALWATAAERGLGLPRFTFMKAYSGNRVEAVRETLDSDLVGASILMFADGFGSEMWEGTCTELRTRLEPFVEESLRKSRVWPQTPRGLSGRLRRLVTFLREAGIVVVFNPKGAKGQRTVTIARTGAH